MSDACYWECPISLTEKEMLICKRLKTTGKLYVFLRTHRHLIFTDEINQQLIDMYKDHPGGKPPLPAAQLAMATILQAYTQQSDASATLDALFDKRWQMVLNCLGTEEPPFSQGSLCDFRHRLIKHNMDETLLSQTVLVAQKVGGFCHKQLKIALDSAPLQGAGRKEDTFNLIGHAMALLVDCAAHIRQTSEAQIIEEAGTKLIGKSSIKAALDIDWTDSTEKKNAINTLIEDVDAIRDWLKTQPAFVIGDSEMIECLSLLEHVLDQNIDPDPNGGSQVKEGTVADRQISIVDNEMRHGRKSSSRTIDGFKQHIAVDMDLNLILATSVRPANEPEHKAAELLKPKVLVFGEVVEYSVDGGYLAADWTTELYAQGKKVIAKPWNPSDKGKFGKRLFAIDLEQQQVTCPEGHTAEIRGDKAMRAKFGADICNVCPKLALCTASKNGRTLTIHPQEEMLQHLKHYVATPQGRADARERVKVEHALASICNRKGPRARYIGCRLNEFDLNRTAMVTNLHVALNLAA